MSTTPHDALFKAVFGQPEHARGILRSIVPAAVGEAIDWRALTLCPGSFERGLGPEAQETFMTLAQQLREQGREQGLAQGREQGLAQGREQASRALLLRLMQQRFGAALEPHHEQRLREATLEQVEVWLLRILTADSPAELLAD